MQKLVFSVAMLGILVLPVVMIGPLLSTKAPKERCLSVVFPGHPDCVPACGLPELTYREFVLTNDTKNNTLQLRQLRQELQRIHDTNDLRNGVRIRVDDAAPFQDYITALDICKSGSRVFTPLPNNVYVPYSPESVEYSVFDASEFQPVPPYE